MGGHFGSNFCGMRPLSDISSHGQSFHPGLTDCQSRDKYNGAMVVFLTIAYRQSRDKDNGISTQQYLTRF